MSDNSDYTVFELFSAHHLLTSLLVLVVAFGVAFFARAQTEVVKNRIGYGIATLIFIHVIVQAIATITYGMLPWVEAIPLHMCDLAAISIGYYLISRQRIFFISGFFWGVGGGGMALLTPVLPYNFPHIEFLFFYYSHFLIFLGVIYASIALGQRPFRADVFTIIKISLVVTGLIYIINTLLGNGANFWYLMTTPAQDTLLNFFPAPPLHLLVFLPIAALSLILLYVPFWLVDTVRGLRKKS